MKYTIRQPKSFCEIGRKDNQEDFLWPAPDSVTTEQRIFIMCDGVGGQESGEVASMTAATAIGTYLTENMPSDGVADKSLFEAALEQAYNALDDADHSDSVRKMATTMTCVVLHRGGALVAHIGDSRIYIVRPSRVNEAAINSQPVTDAFIYKSSDHSLVNDLYRIGELTEEEVRNFPQKNVITRAMQPHGERRCRADIYNITDLRSGDYLFLCSDGVLEQLTDERLCTIVADTNSDEEKIATILSICEGRTRDNHTCWLVPLEEVTPEPGDEQRAIAVLPPVRKLKVAEHVAHASSGNLSNSVDYDGATNEVTGNASASTGDYTSVPAQGSNSPQGHLNGQSYDPTRPSGKYDSPAPTDGKNKKIALMAAAACLLAVLIVGGVYYFLTKDADKKKPDTELFNHQQSDKAKANTDNAGKNREQQVEQLEETIEEQLEARHEQNEEKLEELFEMIDPGKKDIVISDKHGNKITINSKGGSTTKGNSVTVNQSNEGTEVLFGGKPAVFIDKDRKCHPLSEEITINGQSPKPVAKDEKADEKKPGDEKPEL